MREKIRYARPTVTRLGTVERITALVKGTGPPDILGRHRLIG